MGEREGGQNGQQKDCSWVHGYRFRRDRLLQTLGKNKFGGHKYLKGDSGSRNKWVELLLFTSRQNGSSGCWFSCHSRARTAKSVSLSASMITFLRPASHFLPIWCINNVYRVKMWDLNQESENYFPAPLHSNNDVTDISFSKTHPAWNKMWSWLMCAFGPLKPRLWWLS